MLFLLSAVVLAVMLGAGVVALVHLYRKSADNRDCIKYVSKFLVAVLVPVTLFSLALTEVLHHFGLVK